MLSKPRRSASPSHIALRFCYSVFKIILFSEEHGSALLFSQNFLFDLKLLFLVYAVLELNLIILKTGANSVICIILNHKKALNPWCYNSELTALWLFSLLLKMSSDVHPNPGPLRWTNDFPVVFYLFVTGISIH